ncbi:hypothetical protein Goklo_021510 [Gossypium klotzschianum]|uniref:Uncharacterized protein n=1 Tax=Gossypium klotzschianum TaxID=34286 RepID=A0A7J8UWB9_9ROSI|nr:hypothetical protein [Gossypium klotzschianum]
MKSRLLKSTLMLRSTAKVLSQLQGLWYETRKEKF